MRPRPYAVAYYGGLAGLAAAFLLLRDAALLLPLVPLLAAAALSAAAGGCWLVVRALAAPSRAAWGRVAVALAVALLGAAALRPAARALDDAHFRRQRPRLEALAREALGDGGVEWVSATEWGPHRRLRAGLIDAGYAELEVAPEYVAFVRARRGGGPLGVVYLRPGHAPPEPGRPFAGAPRLGALRPLGGRWYAFGGG